MKKVLYILSCIVLLLVGCESMGYLSGDDALYTVAANNLIGAGLTVNETTHVIETDSYGRTLFIYRNSGSVFGFKDALCICQTYDDEYTYYYEDDCILLFDSDGNVSDESLTTFKQRNDWNGEMNEDKMTSAPIVDNFFEKPEYSNSQTDAAANAVEPSCGYEWESVIVCADTRGRQLIVQREYSYETNHLGKTYAVIVSPDGLVDESCGIMEMDENVLADYTAAIKDFKARNNWNQEY